MMAWVIWGLASFFYLYEVVLRVSPSIMTHELMLHFKVSSASLGFLVSAYYYPYVLLQVPGGLIVDGFGSRRVFTISALLCALGITLFALSETLWMAKIARALVGVGSACAFIGTLKVISLWFSKKNFQYICGLTNFMGTVGGIFASFPLAMIVQRFSWQNTCFYFGFLGFGIAALASLIISDPKKPHLTQEDERKFFKGLSYIIKTKEIWIIGMVSGLMYLPVNTFAELWNIPFLKSVYGLSTQVASKSNTLFFLGAGFGGALAAFFADYYKSYLKVMRLSTFLTTGLFIFVLMAYYFPFLFLLLILFMMGFAMGAQVLSFSYINQVCKTEHLGVGVGFCNALTMITAIICQPLVGGIMDLLWKGQLIDGVRVYGPKAYILSFLIFPICQFLAFLFLLSLKEVYPLKSEVSKL